MKQEKMLDKIRKSAEHVPTPTGLEPEHIMETVKRRPQKIKSLMPYCATAAMVAVLVIAFHQGYGIVKGGKDAATVETVPSGLTADVPMPAAGDTGKLQEQYIAKNYDDIYKKIQSVAKSDSMNQAAEARSFTASAKGLEGQNAAAPASLDAAVLGSTGEFNSVIDGIDVVKADDSYLYMLSKEKGIVRIIQTDGELPVEVSEITTEPQEGELQTMLGLFLYGNRLAVIRNQVDTLEQDDGLTAQGAADGDTEEVSPGGAAGEETPQPVNVEKTVMDIYDLANRSQPVLVGTVEQDGAYKSSRMEEGIVYLFTESRVIPGEDQEDKSQFIPQVNGELLMPENIYVPDVVTEASYLIVSSLNMADPQQVLDKKAILSGGQQFYISDDYIYAGNSKYNYDAHQYDYTELLKLKYDAGKVVYQSHALIDGYLDSRFAMDEHGGNLRLISTVSKKEGGTVDSLYILDEKLAVIGSIEDLSPGNQIYATRFIGDMGYFMTFQDADAVFAVDLSDTAHPVELGRLKYGKFPEYLHPFGQDESRLLGIERRDTAADPDAKGLEMGVFDLSENREIKEIHKVTETAYDYSSAWYNPQSVYVSPEGDLIGFGVEQYHDQPQNWQQEYVVYSYSERNGFTKLLEYPFDDEGSYTTRGFRSGNHFYIAGPGGVTVFSMEDFAVKGQLEF